MKRFFKKPFRESLTQNILLIICILVAGYIIVTVSLKGITRHGQEFAVPDFYGMSVAEANEAASGMSLRLVISDSVYIRGMERGAITRQNPEPGSKVKKNRRILLVINSVSPRQSIMPSLTGFSMRQARAELSANGLNIGKLIYVEDMATNNVLAQKYKGRDIAPGTSLNSGSYIDLVVGLNPADSSTFVPNVIGYRYRMATELLHDNSLNIVGSRFDSTVSDYSDSLEAYVYGQYPPASDSVSVRKGSSVTLYLSKDISRIPVPEEETDSTDAQF